MLPIETALPALLDALRTGNRAVLEAPPGAGKTTRVPLALLGEPWLGDRRVVLLEPRRLAARAAAAYMARRLGEPVGGTVGYVIRQERRAGPRTRVLVVTEGVLTRLLQDDPALEGTGAVLFDEFHERNLASDLGLALTLEAQEALRPDLRVLVMSATLDGARVAALLDGAPIVRSEGRSFPVATYYLDRPAEGPVEAVTARAVRRALAETQGDVLAFLPGAAEIRRTAEHLAGLQGVDVLPLHGALPPEAQDRALAPAPPGGRKVVLATDLAETSLTVEGVRAVVDAGLARRPRYDPTRGMDRLETVRVARASADQRRGRAGRLAPGTCYRLWTRAEHAALAPFAEPEIAVADLATLALELAVWGTPNPTTLRWLDPPPETAYAEARALLRALGALDAAGTLTEHGRALATLGVHPRLAHLVLRGRDLGLGATACRLAALLAERDVLRAAGPEPPPADVRLRLDLLQGADPALPPHVHADRAALRRAQADAARWMRRLGIPDTASDPDAAGTLLALAYPDRIAQRREGAYGRFRLRSGHGATLPAHDPLAGEDVLAVASLSGRPAAARVFLAAPIARETLESLFPDDLEHAEEVAWDAATGTVRARRLTRLGALVLREGPLPNPEPEAVGRALLEGLRLAGPEALPWTKEARRLRERLAFLHRLDPATWPDVSDEALMASAETWLEPLLAGARRLEDLRRIDLAEALLARIPWHQRRELDRLAPSHVEVPSGSRIPIDYGRPEAPVLAVRLQEVFGMTETPRVGGGRVPLTMHLLSPAHRPVQVTQDLRSFWATGYFEVRKDLRGRYPKHAWPDDPLSATPTRRTRRR